jgi:DNA polymerase-3 subunit epsilon
VYADTNPKSPGLSGAHAILRSVSHTWGRPAIQAADGWVVVDVETSGFRPGHARVLSIAALALDAHGRVENSVVSLLNPGVDPGPTHVHGLTAEMLEDQPRFADIASDIAELMHGRTLVAHNAPFDYSFLVAEAELAGTALPVDNVMCTVELTRRLDLGLDNLRLETLARHWDIPQTKAHDAFDDALVLSRVLAPALQRARERDVWVPIRPVSRRRWPNGTVTHEQLRPLKMLASRMPCPYLNPGRYQRGGPLVQGMRVALSAEVARTHEELVERILHAGLAYAEAIDPQTSLLICNEPDVEQGKGFQARELGVPMVSDEQFMHSVGAVACGTGIDEFVQSVDQGQQFALF